MPYNQWISGDSKKWLWWPLGIKGGLDWALLGRRLFYLSLLINPANGLSWTLALSETTSRLATIKRLRQSRSRSRSMQISVGNCGCSNWFILSIAHFKAVLHKV